MDLPVMPPVQPMLAKAVTELPDAPPGALLFEPKWDGFRCVVFRDGDEVVLGSRNERPLQDYFPELLDPLRVCLPERCVLDGELLVVLNDRLAFDALQQRIHPAQSRITLLSEQTPAVFVAFDLLAVDDQRTCELPFAERRRTLEVLAAKFRRHVLLTPSTADRATAADWFQRLEGAGLDGVMAKPVDDPYQPGKRAQLKVKHKRTVDAVVAGYRMHRSGDGVGSLVLGLHDAAGVLRHAGVAASFTARQRAELLELLEPGRLDDPAGHPWADWVTQPGEGPGGESRWSVGKDLSFVFVRPERVAEVSYGSVLHGRFRGTTRLVRWRPDRTPESCTYAQLPEVPQVNVSDIFAGGSA